MTLTDCLVPVVLLETFTTSVESGETNTQPRTVMFEFEPTVNTALFKVKFPSTKNPADESFKSIVDPEVTSNDPSIVTLGWPDNTRLAFGGTVRSVGTYNCGTSINIVDPERKEVLFRNQTPFEQTNSLVAVPTGHCADGEGDSMAGNGAMFEGDGAMFEGESMAGDGAMFEGEGEGMAGDGAITDGDTLGDAYKGVGATTGFDGERGTAGDVVGAVEGWTEGTVTVGQLETLPGQDGSTTPVHGK